MADEEAPQEPKETTKEEPMEQDDAKDVTKEEPMDEDNPDADEELRKQLERTAKDDEMVALTMKAYGVTPGTKPDKVLRVPLCLCILVVCRVDMSPVAR